MMVVRERSILSISGIGSCIGLALRDNKWQVSGLAHVVLPDSTGAEDTHLAPGKYGDAAVRILLKRMHSKGAEIGHTTAKLVGGAGVLSSGGFDGSKNAESVRRELRRMNISILAEDVGSTYGRSMKFDTGTGMITIRRFQQADGITELKDTIII
jgi:chemotaxis protein CheD